VAFTGINHICIATTDLDRTTRAWSEVCGLGPWNVYAYDSTKMSTRVGGVPTDFAMRVALCQLGPGCRIEVIEPLDDRSPYAESLRRHDGASHIHHIRLDVDDFDGALAHLDELGLARLFEGTFPGRTGHLDGIYYATDEQVGTVIEVARATDAFTMVEPVATVPEQT